MKIAIDVDGVVADFCGSCIDLVPEGELSQASQITEWNFLAPGWKPGFNGGYKVAWEQQRALIKAHLVNDPHFVQNMKILEEDPDWPRTQESVEDLRVKGHEVFFLTTPYKSAPHWEFERTKWCNRHFPGIPVVFSEQKELMEWDILFDDKPGTHLACKELGRECVLFEAPYNKVSKMFRPSNWTALHNTMDKLQNERRAS